MWQWLKNLFKKKVKPIPVEKNGLHWRGQKNQTISGQKINFDYAGVHLEDCENITIENCEFTGGNSENAHGILVENSKGIKILNNHLHDLRLGHSEAISFHGEDGLIEGNTIERINNIGIDVMGGEEGRGPGKNVIIRNNTIRDIKDTPAWAAGIYVDCGHNVLIEGNTVERCDVGIEVGSEHDQPSTNVTVKHNRCFDNKKVGLLVNTGAGVKYLAMENNLLYGNKIDFEQE